MKRLFGKTLFATLTLLLSLPALAAEKEPKGMYARPTLEEPKYYLCKEDKHCAAANMPCGRVVVVNTIFQKEVQGWSDFVAPRYQCLATAGRQKAENIRCEQNMCKADISQVSQTLPDTPLTRNPSYCESIDDCAVVLGPCYKKIIVNKVYKDAMQKDYDKARELHMEKCFFPDSRTVERLHCRKNTCEADLKIPDQSHWNKPVDMREPQRHE